MRRALIFSLLLSIALTAAAATGKPATDAPASTSARPISTGVTSPQLVRSAKIHIAADELPAVFSGSASVDLKFKLDQTGTPQEIQVVRPLTQAIDARVINAVRQFRWTPAVLNNQTIPIEMDMTVEVLR